jgi:hypothetical protein
LEEQYSTRVLVPHSPYHSSASCHSARPALPRFRWERALPHNSQQQQQDVLSPAIPRPRLFWSYARACGIFDKKQRGLCPFFLSFRCLPQCPKCGVVDKKKRGLCSLFFYPSAACQCPECGVVDKKKRGLCALCLFDRGLPHQLYLRFSFHIIYYSQVLTLRNAAFD